MQRPDAVEVIRELITEGLRRKDHDVVRGAARALAAIDDPAARRALQTLADGADAAAPAAIEALAAGGAKGIADWAMSDGAHSDRWLALAGAAERGIAVDGSQIPFLRRLRLSFMTWGRRLRRSTVHEIVTAVILGSLVSFLLIFPLVPDVPAIMDVRLRALYLGFAHALVLVLMLAPFVRTLDWRLGGWAFAFSQMTYVGLAGAGTVLIVSLISNQFDSRAQVGVMHSPWLTLTTLLMLMLARLVSLSIACACSRPLTRIGQAALALAGAGAVLSTAATIETSGNAASAAIGLAAMVASASVFFFDIDLHQPSVGKGRAPVRSGTALALTLLLLATILVHWTTRAADRIDTSLITIEDKTIERSLYFDTPVQLLSTHNQRIKLTATATAAGVDDIRFGELRDGKPIFSDKDGVPRGEELELDLEANVSKQIWVTASFDDPMPVQNAATGDLLDAFTRIDWSQVLGISDEGRISASEPRYHDRTLQIAIDQMSLNPRPIEGTADRIRELDRSFGDVSIELVGNLQTEEFERTQAFDEEIKKLKSAPQTVTKGATKTASETVVRQGGNARTGHFGVILDEPVIQALSSAAGRPDANLTTSGTGRGPAQGSSAQGGERTTLAKGSLIYVAEEIEGGTEVIVAAGRASQRRLMLAPNELEKWSVAWSPDMALVVQGLTWSLRKAKPNIGHHLESIAAAELRAGRPALAAFHMTSFRLGSAPIRAGEPAMLLAGVGGKIEGRVEVLGERGELVRVRPLHAWWRGPEPAPRAACYEVPRSRVLQPSDASVTLFAAVLQELVKAHEGTPPAWSSSPPAHQRSGAETCIPAKRHLYFSRDDDEDGLYELELDARNLKRNEARKAKHIGRSGVVGSTVGLTSDPHNRTLIGSAWTPLLRIAPDGTRSEEFGGQGAEGLAMDPQYRVLYASINQRFLILNADNGELLAELEAPWGDADCLTLDEQRRILYALSDKGLHSYNIDTHEKKLVRNHDNGAPECGLAFDPVSRRLFASGLGDNHRVLWSIDPDTGKETHSATFDIELKGGLTIVID